jgi:hypothetical protein
MSPMGLTEDIGNGKGTLKMGTYRQKRDRRERADEHKGTQGQLAATVRPVRYKERDAVGGSQDEREKGTGDQRLPADPGEHEPDADGELDVFLN